MTTVVEFAYKLVFRLSLVHGITLAQNGGLHENGARSHHRLSSDHVLYSALIESFDKRNSTSRFFLLYTLRRRFLPREIYVQVINESRERLQESPSPRYLIMAYFRMLSSIIIHYFIEIQFSKIFTRKAIARLSSCLSPAARERYDYLRGNY